MIRLYDLEKRLRGDLIAVFNFLESGSKKWGADLFFLMSGDRVRGNNLKTCEEEFWSDIRKTFLTERVVKHWNKIIKEVVMAPRLSVFKKRSDSAFKYMVYLSGCPVWSQKLGSMILMGLYHIRIVCDSTVLWFRWFSSCYFMLFACGMFWFISASHLQCSLMW